MDAVLPERPVVQCGEVDPRQIETVHLLRPLHGSAYSDDDQNGTAILVRRALVRGQLRTRTPFDRPIGFEMRTILAFDPEPPSRGDLPETEIGEFHPAHVASVRLVVPGRAMDQFEHGRIEHADDGILEVVAHAEMTIAYPLLSLDLLSAEIGHLFPFLEIAVDAVGYARQDGHGIVPERSVFEGIVVLTRVVMLADKPVRVLDLGHGLVAIPAPAVERPQLMAVYEALLGRIT